VVQNENVIKSGAQKREKNTKNGKAENTRTHTHTGTAEKLPFWGKSCCCFERGCLLMLPPKGRQQTAFNCLSANVCRPNLALPLIFAGQQQMFIYILYFIIFHKFLIF